MTDVLEDPEGTVSTGGRTITNLRSSDDIYSSAGRGEEELKKLVERFDKSSRAYITDIGAKKSKPVTKNHQWHQYRE